MRSYVLVGLNVFAVAVRAQGYRVEVPQQYSWTDMNDSGQLVAFAPDGNGASHPVRLTNGIVENLTNIAPRRNDSNVINNNGVLAGYHSGPEEASTFIYVASGQLIEHLYSPVDINDHDEVLGSSAFGIGGQAGGIWGNGSLKTINAEHLQDLYLLGLNNHTAAVGYETTTEFSSFRGVYWSEGTGLVDLGENTIAYGINDRGYIVGDSMVWRDGVFDHAIDGIGVKINEHNFIAGYSHGNAVLWRDGGPERLTDLIGDDRWEFSRIFALNNRDQILAEGYFNGESTLTHVVLTPVPEPTSLLAFGSGLLLLLRRRRR